MRDWIFEASLMVTETAVAQNDASVTVMPTRGGVVKRGLDYLR